MNELLQLAETVVEKLKEKKLIITTVESCTGGRLASCITDVPGASDVISGARVVYSAREKIALGVPPRMTTDQKIYSAATAIVMAKCGVAATSGSHIGVGITGMLSFPDPSLTSRVYIAVVYGRVIKTAVVEFTTESGRQQAKDRVVIATLGLIDSLL